MADKMMELEILSPERTFYNGEASMVEFNTTEGYIGIYPMHVPVAVVVAPGELVIHEVQGTKEAALHSGFAKITQNKVTILAEVVEWADEIDLNRAEEAKKRAEQRISSKSEGIDLVRAEASLKRALTRIQLKNK